MNEVPDDDFQGVVEDDSKSEIRDEDFDMMFSSGDWFMFPKALLLVMSESEAIILSHLLNFIRIRKQIKDEYGGWFFCVRQSIWDELWYSNSRQNRLFQSLEGRGFIKTEWREWGAGTEITTHKWMKVLSKDIYIEFCKSRDRLEKMTYSEATREIAKIHKLKSGPLKGTRPDQSKRMRKRWRRKRREEIDSDGGITGA